MATAAAEIEFIPDEQIEFIPDEAPVQDAIEFIPDDVAPEVVAQEAQRATSGALQTLDVMAAPMRLDWSEVNERLDTERFIEARDIDAAAAEKFRLGQISEPELMGAYRESDRIRSQMLSTTTAGRGQAERVRAAQPEPQATPSEAIAGFLGPGLSSTVMPTVEAAGRHAGSATGGALGAALATVATAGTGGLAPLFLGIGSSILGSYAGGAAQEGILRTAETEEETQQRQQRAVEAAAQNPVANLAGGLLATRPFFGPSIAQFGRAAAGDRGALMNIGLAGSIGAGAEMVGAAMRGEMAKAKDIAAAFFSNAVMNEPTKLGRRLGLLPSSEQQAAEAAQARYAELTPDPEIAAAVSRVGEAGLSTRGTTSTADVFAGVPRRTVPTEVEISGVKFREEPSADPNRLTLISSDASGVKARFDYIRDSDGVLRPAPGSGIEILDPKLRGKGLGGEVTKWVAKNKGPVGSSGISEEVTSPDALRMWRRLEQEGARIESRSEQAVQDDLGESQAYILRTPTGEPNAQQISETSAPDGGMRPPEVASADAIVPTPEGSEGVQPSGQGEPLAQAAPEAPREVEPPAPTPTAPEPALVPPTPEPLDPTATSNKEAVVNAERAQRALDPVIKEATIENPNAIDYAERAIEADPARPQRIIDRLRTNPMERTISVEDAGILLIERTKLRARRDAALARASRGEGDAMDKAIAEAEFIAVENQLNSMDQAAQDARSTWGRFGQLWQRSMREDFSLANLERRARLSKDGPLTETDLAKLTEISQKAEAAHDKVQARQKQLETESTQSAIDNKIAEVSEKNAPTDPAVKSLADRIVARLDLAAKNATTSLRSRLNNLGSAPDPLIVLDVAKIAAARTAKSAIEFAQWSAEMVKEFGEKVRPFLQAGWEQREQHIDTAIDAGAGKKKREVTARVKKAAPLDAAAQQVRVEAAIGNRIKEGKPISSLAPYVNKLQESFISQGVTEREALIDAVHGSLRKHDPAITRDETMEVMSKYGSDYATPLSKDPVKMTRREVDGQIQQLLKLRDISAKVPLPKSGPERPTPGPVWRALIKQVNEAKKKLGVVVTDPETQLKSSQDAIRTRLRNDIEDMTLEIETGVKPPEKTTAEYTQDMEILRGVRDRVRQTLREIEGNPNLTEEQRLAMTKRSAEASLEMWERRLAGEQAKVRKGVTNPEIEAIRARRDAVKAQVEEIDAADAVLQENRKAEALVRQIQSTENQLLNNAARARTQGADSELVAEARAELRTVREALAAKNAADPQRQMEAVEKAEQALEASIKKLDEQIQAGNIAVKAKRTGLQSERLEYLRAQRDAMTKLRTHLRNEAKPRLSADQLAIKMRTTQMLQRAAELRQRIAAGDFGPRTRKAPVDFSGDRAALDAQADLMSVDAEFQKLQEQWKLDQMNWVQKRWRNVGQAWDAGANLFLSFDLSTPLQTAFAMASRPVEGARAVGKGARAFFEQFVRGSDEYARREAARIANSTNSKNGLYKAMKLELPSALGKKREENMASVLEQLADLDARWAGLPDVVKGIYKMEGKSLVKGGKRLASVIPKIAGSGIKASNAAFETIANTMRARTADAMLARWYKRGGPAPTKQQLELIGELVNVATGKGGLKGGDSVRRILFAPNYYLSIIKQLSGYQFLRAGYHLEGKIARDVATEYVRAIATMGAVYGLNVLFGNEVPTDPRDKNFGRPKTDRGTSIDFSMGRGAWITAGAQIASGKRIEKGRAKDLNRKETLLNFFGGRLSRPLATSVTSAFGEDYRGKPITAIDVAKDFVVPLAWRDFDDVLKREGFTRGSFLQLLNVLGINYRIAK